MRKSKENVVLLKGKVDDGELKNIRKIIEGILVEMGLVSVELSVVFVNFLQAKKLNEKYRNMDYVPQVLAFPISKKKDADRLIRLGDVVICIDKWNEEVKVFKREKMEVLREWIKHGIKNLLK
ncbi:rRNA maturation RNase YbeY [Patescibacteria group bacterium]|nr:rRNA maturation RNase YbeY [Patescibacteria group bacterium]MCG2701540.1 rRNA maturation RNase YbeY [Candidatus Parcubacteria bacterium]MBU4210920.1 rRNA maturation RNase YbeY [Patescibacteria group bacterium]MBU4265257.1 rRNA maturation RNase YbeY [Patescibacteria group bacterium]MBU4389942.1 rRNA maturation RNase YbeY [Patescibacteria group bacterium]